MPSALVNGHETSVSAAEEDRLIVFWIRAGLEGDMAEREGEGYMAWSTSPQPASAPQVGRLQQGEVRADVQRGQHRAALSSTLAAGIGAGTDGGEGASKVQSDWDWQRCAEVWLR